MMNLFFDGGALFMGILSLILLLVILVFIRSLSKRGQEATLDRTHFWLRSLGSLGLLLGVFGQLIGLYSAFTVMESVDSMSPSILAGGLRVSLITTLYGLS